jgi:hypothetical protein
VGGGLVAVAEHHMPGGGHPAVLHQLLGIGLRALDPGRGGGGAERADALLAQPVHEAVHQRHLGAHHHQVRGEVARHRHERFHVSGSGVQTGHAVPGDARVAGDARHLGPLGAAQEGANERVLAAPLADH